MSAKRHLPSLPRRLFWKLSGAFLLAVLLALGVGGAALIRALEQREQLQLIDHLRSQATLFRYAMLRNEVSPSDMPVLQYLAKSWSHDAQCRVTVITGTGAVVADSEQSDEMIAMMENHAGRPEVRAALQGIVGADIRHSATLHRPMLYVAVPLDPVAPHNGVIRLAVPMNELKGIKASAHRMIICGLLVMVLLAGLLALLITQWVTRPVRHISDVAQRITRGELHARASITSRDEVGVLGRTINTMAEQLERRVQELEVQRNQARAILESMVEGVCAIDRNGRILWLNPSAQRLLGIDSHQVSEKRFTELFRQPVIDQLVADVLAKHRPAACEARAFTPQERVIRFQAAPCDGGVADRTSGKRSATQTEAALVLVAQDVTEMRRLDQMRREFVVDVSHELKTPLTSIQSLVETLLNGALEDHTHNRRFISLIEEDAKRLTRLIDDLLELSQIESKAVPPAFQPVAIRRMIEELADRVRQPMQERHVTLDIAIPHDAPQVRGDPERLRQVFLNLLDNAITFNKPGGSITVTAIPNGDTLRVAVEDGGIGIPASDLPRIFERFYRVDKARSRELGGTGLGLSIVKHLVELHQGGVEVESEPGVGSRFTITLPLWLEGSSPSR